MGSSSLKALTSESLGILTGEIGKTKRRFRGIGMITSDRMLRFLIESTAHGSWVAAYHCEIVAPLGSQRVIKHVFPNLGVEAL